MTDSPEIYSKLRLEDDALRENFRKFMHDEAEAAAGRPRVHFKDSRQLGAIKGAITRALSKTKTAAEDLELTAANYDLKLDPKPRPEGGALGADGAVTPYKEPVLIDQEARVSFASFKILVANNTLPLQCFPCKERIDECFEEYNKTLFSTQPKVTWTTYNPARDPEPSAKQRQEAEKKIEAKLKSLRPITVAEAALHAQKIDEENDKNQDGAANNTVNNNNNNQTSSSQTIGNIKDSAVSVANGNGTSSNKFSSGSVFHYSASLHPLYERRILPDFAKDCTRLPPQQYVQQSSTPIFEGTLLSVVKHFLGAHTGFSLEPGSENRYRAELDVALGVSLFEQICYGAPPPTASIVVHKTPYPQVVLSSSAERKFVSDYNKATPEDKKVYRKSPLYFVVTAKLAKVEVHIEEYDEDCDVNTSSAHLEAGSTASGAVTRDTSTSTSSVKRENFLPVLKFFLL